MQSLAFTLILVFTNLAMTHLALQLLNDSLCSAANHRCCLLAALWWTVCQRFFAEKRFKLVTAARETLKMWLLEDFMEEYLSFFYGVNIETIEHSWCFRCYSIICGVNIGTMEHSWCFRCCFTILFLCVGNITACYCTDLLPFHSNLTATRRLHANWSPLALT